MSLAFTWRRFYSKCSIHISLIWIWRLLIWGIQGANELRLPLVRIHDVGCPLHSASLRNEFLWNFSFEKRNTMDLLPDTWNCGLCMRRECREHFTRHRLQRKPLVIDPGMHHGTCYTHVPWHMSGSPTRGGGENVPGIPVPCTTRNFKYLARGPFLILYYNLCWKSVFNFYDTLNSRFVITGTTSSNLLNVRDASRKRPFSSDLHPWRSVSNVYPLRILKYFELRRDVPGVMSE